MLTKAALQLLSPISNDHPQTDNDEDMKMLVKRIVVPLFATAFLAIVGVGCRTAHGFGEDMQNAGESIQDGTK